MQAYRTKVLRTTFAVFGLGLLLLGSAPAWAADMCFREDTTNVTYVGKNFTFPAAGLCKAFDGFGLGGGCIFSGTACGTSDNSAIRFTLQYACSAPNAFGIMGTRAFTMDRLYPGLDKAHFGYYYEQHPGGGDPTWWFGQYHVKTIPCGVASVPVP